MTSLSTAALSLPAADSDGDSATSTTTADAPAEITTSDIGLVAASSTAAVQTDLTSSPPAPSLPDSSSVPPSLTSLSDPVPSTSSSSALQLSSRSSVSSTSLVQSHTTPGISTTIKPDTQITNASFPANPAPLSDKSLSTGAVVGIAIGCAVAGLIIGLLASVLLLRTRRRPAARQEIGPHAGARSPDSRAVMATPTVPVAGASDLDQFLPVPKSEKELADELQSLGHLIMQHVEDNYVTHVAHAKEPLSLVLWDLGLRDGEDTMPTVCQLEAMALDPNKRVSALQHVIARVIFGSMTIKWMGKTSLLPPSVLSLVREMPPCEKHTGSPEAYSAALTRWRQITAFLLNSRRSERGVLVPVYTTVQPRARQLAKEMNRFLGVFVDKKNREHQQNHLEDVVLECTKLGYSIFSQPADFTWEFASGDDRYIVVCPGLVKVSDSQGVRCQPEMTIPPELEGV